MKIIALEGNAVLDVARALLLAAVLAVVALVLVTTPFVPASSGPTDAALEHTSCLTPADVRRHAERGREGISLVCNEEIRQHNLQGERRL